MGRFDGRVALVTGSGRGMGRAHALKFAEGGADVIVHDILESEAKEVAQAVEAMGRKARLMVVDIADTKAMAEAVREAESAMGRIDILVNNAGVPGEREGIESIDEAFFDRMYAVHVRGTFFTTRAVVPGMKARGYGKIVNISSMWAQTGHHFASTYISAKSAILGFTKSWAREFAPWKICVNAVTPGGVVTEMVMRKGGMDYVREASKKVPLQRYAECEEIAHAVCFLASSEADFISGQVVGPNGGQAIVGI